jgi:hypothetical protein
MGKITLAGAIPGDNNDGVGPHSKDFIDEAKRRYERDEPMQIFNVVCRVAVSKVVVDTVKRLEYPVLRIQHWEIVPADQQAAFGKMIGQAFGARTGAAELPFPDDQVPIEDPFPEDVAEAARQAIEDDVIAADGEGEPDELARTRASRRRTGSS